MAMADKKSTRDRGDAESQNKASDEAAKKRVEEAEARNAEVIEGLKTSNDPPSSTQ